MPFSMTVSALQLCHRCPRLLAYQKHGRVRAWQVGLSGSGRLPGRLFHDRIAAPFHALMASGPDTLVFQHLVGLLRGPTEHLDLGLLGLLEDHVFLPAMRRYGKTLRAEQILQLGRGLLLWSHQMAAFLRPAWVASHHDAARLASCFHPPEGELGATYRLDDGRTLQVTGRYDALLFDPAAGEAVLVEFKGRKAGQVDADLLQLALYAWLLQAATGVMPRGVVLYLDEDRDPDVTYSAADLQHATQHVAHLFRQVLEVDDGMSGQDTLPAASDPQLCHVCPFEPQCDRDWGVRAATRRQV